MAELLRRIGRSKHILLKKRACELKRNRERESQELCVVYYVSIGERERERVGATFYDILVWFV